MSERARGSFRSVRGLLDEIIYRQRRIRRSNRTSVALRALDGGIRVKIPSLANRPTPRSRSGSNGGRQNRKRFQKAVDIFTTSSLRVNDRRRRRSGLSDRRVVADMASRFAGLRPSDQLPYLRCAEMLEKIPHDRRGVTVCSDPFLVFLLDFAEESKATEALINRSMFPETMSRPNDIPTGGGQVTRIQLPDVEYVYEEALVPQEDPLLSELPSKAHLLSSARQMWDNLTEDEREPYRFRAVLAALFPAALDQAF